MGRPKRQIMSNRPVIFDRPQAMILLAQGYSYSQVGKILGVTKGAVHSAVAHLMPDVKKVTAMKTLKEDMMLETAYNLLEAINDNIADNKVPLKDLTNSLNTVIDKYQLLSGGATSHTRSEVKHTGNIDDNIIDIETLDD